MLIDYVLVLLLLIVPLFYRYNQWLFLFENFDYKFNDFRKFLFSGDSKELVFHFWFILEIFFLIMSIFMIFHKPFEIILYNLYFYFLVLLNIYYFGKVLRGKIKLATFSIENYLIGALFLFIVLGDISYIVVSKNYIYTYFYIILLLIFLPLICLANFYISSLLFKKVKKIIPNISSHK